jgi:NAD(P)-dependent dehydrogenase (short-subunit alcohol dehydrogenase family)
LLKQVGGIVGKILHSAKPAEFPIQRPIYLSFLINMHTARLLQLTIPPSLQLRRCRGRSSGCRIVNTASMLGLFGGWYPNIGYQATKGAVVNMTRSWAIECGPLAGSE